jgi:hypothetical protein
MKIEYHFYVRNISFIEEASKLTCTRVVQNVRGQLRFYHFNWVNIYIPYTKMFVVKFQFKIKWILIILVSLN